MFEYFIPISLKSYGISKKMKVCDIFVIAELEIGTINKQTCLINNESKCTALSNVFLSVMKRNRVKGEYYYSSAGKQMLKTNNLLKNTRAYSSYSFAW